MERLHQKWEKVYPEPAKDAIMGIRANKTALGCLKGLRDYNFLSFPVTSAEDDYKVIGIVDMKDICAFVLEFFQDFDAITTPKTFGELLEKKLKDHSVKELMNYSHMDVFHPINSKATFHEVLQALTLPGVHRVPMLDQYSHFGRFVTQSEVLRFIATNLEDFGSVLDKTVMEAGIGTQGVKKVHEDSSAIFAFKTIVENKISAVPVVNSDDHIVGVVSVRDIRHLLGVRANTELKLPLTEFLEHLRAGDNVPTRAVVGSVTETVRDVITRIHSNRIHRLFMIDADDRVHAVVSISDIFKYLIAHHEKFSRLDKEAEIARLNEEATRESERKKHKREIKAESKRLKKLVETALVETSSDEGDRSPAIRHVHSRH